MVNPRKDFTGTNVSVSLCSLMEMTERIEWTNLFENIKSCQCVTIVDDLKLQNNELISYKEFYLKCYYSSLINHCAECYVSKCIK